MTKSYIEKAFNYIADTMNELGVDYEVSNLERISGHYYYRIYAGDEYCEVRVCGDFEKTKKDIDTKIEKLNKKEDNQTSEMTKDNTTEMHYDSKCRMKMYYAALEKATGINKELSEALEKVHSRIAELKNRTGMIVIRGQLEAEVEFIDNMLADDKEKCFDDNYKGC